MSLTPDQIQATVATLTTEKLAETVRTMIDLRMADTYSLPVRVPVSMLVHVESQVFNATREAMLRGTPVTAAVADREHMLGPNIRLVESGDGPFQGISFALAHKQTRLRVDLRRALARELWNAVYHLWEIDENDAIVGRSDRVKIGEGGLPIEWTDFRDGTEHYVDEKTLEKLGIDCISIDDISADAFRIHGPGVLVASGPECSNTSKILGDKPTPVHQQHIIDQLCPSYGKIDFSLPENENGGFFKGGRKVDCSRVPVKGGGLKAKERARRRRLAGVVPAVARQEARHPVDRARKEVQNASVEESRPDGRRLL